MRHLYSSWQQCWGKSISSAGSESDSMHLHVPVTCLRLSCPSKSYSWHDLCAFLWEIAWVGCSELLVVYTLGVPSLLWLFQGITDCCAAFVQGDVALSVQHMCLLCMTMFTFLVFATDKDTVFKWFLSVQNLPLLSVEVLGILWTFLFFIKVIYLTPVVATIWEVLCTFATSQHQ